MLLQDPETSPPVMAIKMVMQAVPVLQGPRAVGKGALELVRALWETDVKYLVECVPYD